MFNRGIIGLRVVWLLVALIAGAGCMTIGENSQVSWEIMPPLRVEGNTASMGISGAFAGFCNGRLLVIGGCNFPNRPVAEGGTKQYYQEIFLLDGTQWRVVGAYPSPVAYGATVTVSDGLICIGGNNSEGPLTTVYKLSWNVDESRIVTQPLPDLPMAMDNLAAAIEGDCIYVTGGNQNGAPGNALLRLNLQKMESGWERLPNFLGAARVQPSLVAQSGSEGTSLYLIGGFQPFAAEMPPIVHNSVLRYDIARGEWNVETVLPDNPDGVSGSLVGGGAVALGTDSLLIMGGVKTDIFWAALDRPRQITLAKENGETKLLAELQKEADSYLTHPVDWYQFNPRLLRYNPRAKEWTLVTHCDSLARAGAGIVPTPDGIIIVGGELKPGIRTPEVNRLKIKLDK